MGEPAPFSFVCRHCGGSAFTRTAADRWDAGAVLATPGGAAQFVAHGGAGGTLTSPPQRVGVACDNEHCPYYNQDLPHLGDLVVPGSDCWLPGMLAIHEGVPLRVVAIDPNPDLPCVTLASGWQVDPRELQPPLPPPPAPRLFEA